MKMKITSLVDAMVIAKHQLGIKIEGSVIKGYEWFIPDVERESSDTHQSQGVHFEGNEQLIEGLNNICNPEHIYDEVIEQIKYDINVSGDVTALDELLRTIPIVKLINYLPEKIKQ
jgi:hypothetical protein